LAARSSPRLNYDVVVGCFCVNSAIWERSIEVTGMVREGSAVIEETSEHIPWRQISIPQSSRLFLFQFLAWDKHKSETGHEFGEKGNTTGGVLYQSRADT
jgi:hypothetical protein